MKFRKNRKSIRRAWRQAHTDRSPLVSETDSNIAKTLATIDADLNTLGWDKPSQLYQLIEDATDPSAQLIGILPTYPPDDLISGYDAGSRCPEFVHGLVVTNEGYRHLSLEELGATNPDVLAKMKTGAQQWATGQDFKGLTEEQVVVKYYEAVVLPQLAPPSSLPENMRIEVRITTAVMRDGVVHKLVHARGSDSIDMFTTKVDGEERFPTTMYMFLHGVRPQPDCGDPIQVVEDYKTLEALSALPVAEGH